MGAAAGETPPWPGCLPGSMPAVVHPDPRPAEVCDAEGQVVGVSARGLVSGAPARMSLAGGPWVDVVAWAGPWLAEERWWDPVACRRRARFQVQLTNGSAHLVMLEGGRWQVEATYD